MTASSASPVPQPVPRLDRLYRRRGGLVIGFRGRLDRAAARALAVEVHTETLERSAALVEEHAERLSGVPELADRLAELRSSLEDVRKLYVAEKGGVRGGGLVGVNLAQCVQPRSPVCVELTVNTAWASMAGSLLAASAVPDIAAALIEAAERTMGAGRDDLHRRD